ncbi:MAG: DUF3881 family protein [Clostridium sp.]|jgi:hypothetical protein|nr:DUF3881 family protein [Clostridium sp.]
MRAIGFSEYKDRQKLRELLMDVILHADRRDSTTNQEHVLIGEFSKEFADGLGITVCGEFDEANKFSYDYYYPFLRGRGITTQEDVSVERHADKESYAGVCDDLQVGISMIFYLQNFIPYMDAQNAKQLPILGTSLTLSALSISASIMMPIQKDEMQQIQKRIEAANRSMLIDAAKKGDEAAIETLTMEEMDIYTTVSRRVLKEDVYSLVDTYFMPFGVECDQYSILGEITQVREVKNERTKEKLYLLTVSCNELTFDVSINIIDLFGEPQVGRRFKGIIWLQGHINYPLRSM